MKINLRVNDTFHLATSTLLPVPRRTSKLRLGTANAVYHATGTRVRSLPISIEKVLGLQPGR